jgi:hypothetical protein
MNTNLLVNVPFLRRKAIGLTHRAFSKYGRTCSRKEVLETTKLLFPNKYYGHAIRLGGDSDGAYVVPDLLEGISASISPGVSEESEFDLELGKRGIYSYMFDASVNRPSRLTEKQFFEQTFLDSYESETTKTLSSIVANVNANHPGDLLLQMDIEGAEYRCLHATDTAVLAKFRIIILEFHDLDLFINNNLYRKFWIHPILNKLRINHDVVHVHANNYGHVKDLQGLPMTNVLEITYLRRDCWPNDSSIAFDGRTLDILNRPDKQGQSLDGPWFQHLQVQ